MIEGQENIPPMFTIRGMNVFLDTDIAVAYGVALEEIHKAVTLHPSRFPSSRIVYLTPDDLAGLFDPEGNPVVFPVGNNITLGLTMEAIFTLSFYLETEDARQTSDHLTQHMTNYGNPYHQSQEELERLNSVHAANEMYLERVDRFIKENKMVEPEVARTITDPMALAREVDAHQEMIGIGMVGLKMLSVQSQKGREMLEKIDRQHSAISNIVLELNNRIQALQFAHHQYRVQGLHVQN